MNFRLILLLKIPGKKCTTEEMKIASSLKVYLIMFYLYVYLYVKAF